MVSKKILGQYSDLQEEIIELRQRIEKTEQQLAKIEEQGAVVDKVMGGDGGLQPFRIEGFPYPEYSRKRTLLCSRKETLRCREKKLDEMINQIEKFVSDIDDSRMRRIISFRFIEKMSWNKVAQRIGGNTTADSVRMEFNRFMEE